MSDLYYAFNPWWEGKPFDSGLPRIDYAGEMDDILGRKQIDILIGSRRVGKTTFIKQIIKKYLEDGIPPRNMLYLTLDNPKLSRTAVSDHLRLFRKIFSHSRDERLYLFLDEVQESPEWELELKGIYDLEMVKMICSGSTASMMERQRGRLAGRQIVTTMYPLSFREFLAFRRETPSRSEDYRYENLFEEYLETGGYPENVLNPSWEYLNNLVDDILYRDVARIYDIRRSDVLKDLLILLAASVGSRTSYNSLSKTLGLAIDTVKEYIGYLESAFLVKQIEKWSPSHKDRIYAQKKIYLTDTGIKTLLTGTGDLGAKTESLVFMDLLKRGVHCGYFAESQREVDFVFGSYAAPEAVEVKYKDSFDWEDKRFSGARLFLRRNPQAKKMVIVTRSAETEREVDQTTITATPAWKYVGPGLHS